MVSQDDQNPGANQNYKLVPWQSIAGPMGLTVDNTFNPRSIGAGDSTPLPQPIDPSPSPSPSPGTGSGGAGTGGSSSGATGAGGTPTTGAVGAGSAQVAATATGAFGSRVAVRAVISAKKGLRATRTGRLKFVVHNDNAFAVSGRATLATSGGTRLAAPVRFKAVRNHTVELRLSRRARALLRHGARKVELALTLRDPAGHVRGVWVTFRLRAR